MKDGYNSAHRYYLNVFRDTYRQVLIGESTKHIINLEYDCHAPQYTCLYMYRKSGNFHYKNIFVVDGSYEN